MKYVRCSVIMLPQRCWLCQISSNCSSIATWYEHYNYSCVTMQRIIIFIILLCLSFVGIHSASVLPLVFHYFYVSYPRYRNESVIVILLNVALVERKTKGATRARWMRFTTSPTGILNDVKLATRTPRSSDGARQLRRRRSATWKLLHSLLGSAPWSRCPQTPRGERIVTSLINDEDAHNNNISSVVSRHTNEHG